LRNQALMFVSDNEHQRSKQITNYEPFTSHNSSKQGGNFVTQTNFHFHDEVE
jgi:hypothetical protein